MSLNLERTLEGETRSLRELYEAYPQPAGLTLTIAQCDELQLLGIPWPISGDRTRTNPVRRQTLTLRLPQHDQDAEDAAARLLTTQSLQECES